MSREVRNQVFERGTGRLISEVVHTEPDPAEPDEQRIERLERMLNAIEQSASFGAARAAIALERDRRND